jgi:hypothetical protein
VLADAGIAGNHLSDLVADKDIDLAKVERLLAAMQTSSKPIKPARLGVIGQAHFEKALAATGIEKCRYWKEEMFDDTGARLPVVMEIAFAINNLAVRQKQRRAIGLNWSPVFKMPSGYIAEAFNECRIELNDAVTIFMHIAQPCFTFSDHGKGALAE